MPMTPLSGVRISWLMLAKNSLLAALGGLGGGGAGALGPRPRPPLRAVMSVAIAPRPR